MDTIDAATQEMIMLSLSYPTRRPSFSPSPERDPKRDTRRHGTIFPLLPSSPSPISSGSSYSDKDSSEHDNPHDQFSSFHFRPPSQPNSILLPSSSSYGGSGRTRCSSEAQEYAAMFRARWTQEVLGGMVVERPSLEGDASSVDLSSGSETTSEIGKGELRPRFSSSREDELELARHEATLMMLRAGRGNREIACERLSCNDILPNIRALMFHLHIHNLSDRL
ncbi:hypothetical protein JAAARDRAFT_439427 [Jaapia argillacea MUCL 33604]|uniref:Uncharacterized protein n=1 Tax=Jaapia argillacea MUCL 33604 TaxID=933084 RepID=A0A067PEC4_9AGAM|nr:hypothetical protein JAAARDRAFT_439427 [Jaapia argillacea MUCL 33604]